MTIVVDGGWCDKEAWGDCQTNGLQTRIRKCECPPQLNGGRMCPGLDSVSFFITSHHQKHVIYRLVCLRTFLKEVFPPCITAGDEIESRVCMEDDHGRFPH